MEELFGNIYCWFESLFGQNLAEYLWGYNCLTQVYSGKNLFNSIGLITAVVSLAFVLAYYYLPLYLFNHPRSNRWWNWLIILLIAGIINFFIGYWWTINDFLNGNIGDCLIYTRDEQENIIAQHIFKSDCRIFGLSNFIISTIFFVGWSMMLIWWSRNCKHSPLF
jgi:amino acid transporter